MKASKQTQREARQLFRACLVDGVLDEKKARKAADLLVSKKPRGYLQVLTQLHKLLRLEIQRRTALVESAVELSKTASDEITKELEKQHGAGLAIEFVTRPELIGGMRVRVGSQVVDATVKSRLETIREAF